MSVKVEKLYNQGISCFKQQQYFSAKESFEEALRVMPNNSQLSQAMAITLANLADYDGAKKYYEFAIKNAVHEPELNLLDEYGYLLKHIGDIEGASEIYEKIVARDRNFLKGWVALADNYLSTFQFDKALKCLNVIMEKDPNNITALLGLSKVYHSICMWEKAEEIDCKLVEISKNNIAKGLESPLDIHTASLFVKDPAFIKEIAIDQSKYTEQYFKASGTTIEYKEPSNQYDRVRIGYLSSAFSQHATAYVLQDLFKHHDKDKFETFGFAGLIKRPCKMFDKISNDFEHFYDVSKMSDPAIAQFIHDKELDVLVDLDGMIKHNKRGAVYFKPAPIVIQWMGTPATLGAPWIDYILVDDVVIPTELEEFYTEKVLRLPDSYFFNSFASLDVKLSGKEEWGLPKDKFIFASFNVSRKVDRDSFLAWCEILKRVENSVLWMLIDNNETKEILEKVLCEQGIDPKRLIPTERVSVDKHMSRLHNADLMLDCFICGAHTTAVEALWQELPVVTKIGKTFQSRVPSSILAAAGLDMLITHSVDEFIERAIEIATSPDKLLKLKKYLKENKNSLPLFNQRKWVKDFESLLVEVIHQK